MTVYPADLASIRAAQARIAPYVHRTPVLTCSTLDALAGARLFLKCENLQRGGAFKARGAHNAVFALTDDVAERGVVTHSSGNHAQALALAARARGIRAHLVMPANAPAIKRAAVEGYGGIVHPCEPTLEAREREAARIAQETGATLVPPYDHPAVIAGQGTAALELLEEIPALDAIVAPVGGGGLVSGTALCATELSPSTSVFAAEPAGADDAARSKASGVLVTEQTPRTIADGLRTTLGLLTWPVIRDRVADVIVVDDGAIVRAMRLLFERAKLVVEPSGAVPLAAVLDERFRARGLSRVGVILSGGNVDLDALPW
ncbi:MAG: pyridoxal-phosphate dependent enzyme [Sandaracinaceae bacterium]|nr:pyridoxal-phosphate dependent enzyme [Sandaracinaceae bacterium]